MVFTLLCIRFGFDVKKSVHISGEANWRCDRLSRIHEYEESISDTLEKMNLGQTVVVDQQGDQNVRTLLACCDPGRDVVGEEAFYAFWEEIRGA